MLQSQFHTIAMSPSFPRYGDPSHCCAEPLGDVPKSVTARDRNESAAVRGGTGHLLTVAELLIVGVS
jgi:hypothetical protein